MDQRLEKLADEAEIRNLIARLAQLADSAPNFDEYLACFTEDAECVYFAPGEDGAWTFMRHGGAGRAGIAEDRMQLRAAGIQGPGTNTFHLNTTLVVSVGDNGTAQAQSYWLFIDGNGSPQVRHIGRYEDQFRRTADGWKLHRRKTMMNASVA
jgi:ketosteroid isomerase-like protein